VTPDEWLNGKNGWKADIRGERNHFTQLALIGLAHVRWNDCPPDISFPAGIFSI